MVHDFGNQRVVVGTNSTNRRITGSAYVSNVRQAWVVEAETRPAGGIPDRTSAPKELCQHSVGLDSVVLPET